MKRDRQRKKKNIDVRLFDRPIRTVVVKKGNHGLFAVPVKTVTVKNFPDDWIERQQVIKKPQLEWKSNAAPCTGNSDSICAVFNVGTDTSDTNGGGTNGNGATTNGNGNETKKKKKARRRSPGVEAKTVTVKSIDRAFSPKKSCCTAIKTGSTPSGYKTPIQYCGSLGIKPKYC